MIVPGKAVLTLVLGAAALGFVIALAMSPAVAPDVDGAGDNIVFLITNNITVTIEPAKAVGKSPALIADTILWIAAVTASAGSDVMAWPFASVVSRQSN